MIGEILGAIFGEGVKSALGHLFRRPVRVSPTIAKYKGNEGPRDGKFFRLLLTVQNDGEYPIELLKIEERTSASLKFVPEGQKSYRNAPGDAFVIIGTRGFPELNEATTRSLKLECNVKAKHSEEICVYLWIEDDRTWSANFVLWFQVLAEKHATRSLRVSFDFPD